jgi:hypothetical protein
MRNSHLFAEKKLLRERERERGLATEDEAAL